MLRKHYNQVQKFDILKFISRNYVSTIYSISFINEKIKINNFGRFCCTFEEKRKELPDFDPNTHEDPEFSYLYQSDWHHFGFWNTLLVTATIVLILGLMIYMISCIFVEVIIKMCSIHWNDLECKIKDELP